MIDHESTEDNEFLAIDTIVVVVVVDVTCFRIVDCGARADQIRERRTTSDDDDCERKQRFNQGGSGKE